MPDTGSPFYFERPLKADRIEPYVANVFFLDGEGLSPLDSLDFSGESIKLLGEGDLDSRSCCFYSCLVLELLYFLPTLTYSFGKDLRFEDSLCGEGVPDLFDSDICLCAMFD